MTKCGNFDRVMDAGAISKNGASPKSQTSKANFLIIACCALMAVFCGCQKEKGGENVTPARMNIDEAKSLFIASSTSGSKVYGVKKSSTKSTAGMDGEIFEISYLDNTGNPIVKEHPRHIYDAGNFVIVCFGDKETFLLREAYFVNKSNGLIYAIPQDKLPLVYLEEYDNSPAMFMGRLNKVQLDRDGNVYYVGVPETRKTLYKVSAVTSSAINITQVSAVNDYVVFFCVDSEGNILYSGSKNNSESVIRYRKASDGSLVSYTQFWEEHKRKVWTGTDGVMYEINTDPHYMMVEAENGHVEYTKISFMKMQDGQPSDIIQEDIVEGRVMNFYGFYVQGRIILLSRVHGTKNYLIDVSNESSYKIIPCSIETNLPFEDKLLVVEDKLCYFNYDAFSYTLIDIDTGQTSLLYSFDKSKLGNYDVDQIMSVTESGVVFSAIQLTDGKYVVAKLDTNGTVTIQQTIEGTVSVVMPLNL